MDPRNKYSANAQDYDKIAQIEDTFTTLAAVNPDRYPETYKMLLGYPKGYPMVVPYYHRSSPMTDIRSTFIDLSMDEDAIHEDLTLIENLEMKLEEQIQFTVSDEDSSTQLTGSAIMYPGFEPRKGDLFFMEVDNRQSMVFKIDVIEPTTYRQERYYRVKFVSYTQLTAQLLQRLTAAVTDVCHFDKRKYFGESELTFLSNQSYKELKELRHLRKSIAQDLINFFFDRDGESFFRPDGIYDPYLTEYLRGKLTVRENQCHPLQLLVPLLNYDKTIWYKLTLAENCEDLSDLWQFCKVQYKDPSTFTSDFNALVSRYYLEIADGGGLLYPYIGNGNARDAYSAGLKACGCFSDPRYPRLIPEQNHRMDPDRYLGYMEIPCPVCSKCQHEDSDIDGSSAYGNAIFTPNFYNGYVDSGTSQLESILYRYLQTRTVDVRQILMLVRPYRKFGQDVRALYTFALYLELVDAAIVVIR